MPDAPSHVAWLKRKKEPLLTEEDAQVDRLVLRHVDDDDVLSEWATHFRNHYCLDDEIDELREGTGLSRAEFLRQTLFPDAATAPGPSIRAGDFAEILVADYLEFSLKYWVPRTRYSSKEIKDESAKGVDILAFRIKREGRSSPGDELLTFEVKAQFSGRKPNPRLRDAVLDSVKDRKRKAMSLHATKQKLRARGDLDGARQVARFQNITDHPYKELTGAAAVFCDSVYSDDVVIATETADHPDCDNLKLLVVTGDALMQLVTHLYDRAADEA
jgi:hypothetical protein